MDRVFEKNSTIIHKIEKFNFKSFSRVFFLVLTKFSFSQRDWALDYRGRAAKGGGEGDLGGLPCRFSKIRGALILGEDCVHCALIVFIFRLGFGEGALIMSIFR